MNKMPKLYKPIDFPPLTDDELKVLENLSNLKDEDIDTSDCPEAKGNGGFYYIQSLKMPQTKIYTSVDTDLLDWLKKYGKGYQKRLNAVLRWAKINSCPIEMMAEN